MNKLPHELALGDVYLSPWVPVFGVALLGAWLSITLLNKARLSRYLMYPSATFLAFIALYILLMDAFLIKI